MPARSLKETSQKHLVLAFVQARMSSRRFPGKVMAPFKGQPLIRHVVMAIERALPSVPIVVVTSREESDDPLTAYLEASNISVFRGPLDNVFERFRKCACEHRCEWILRLSGDSPLLNAQVLQAVASHANGSNCDLVTTIFPRTLPKGHNAELIRVNTFMSIKDCELSASDQEHVTSFYYRNANRFSILNLESGKPRLAELSFAIDSIEDLHRLEQLSEVDLQGLSYERLLSKPATRKIE